MQWALTGLGLALLVLLVLPSAQIKLGASQLHGLIGSYTSSHYWQVSYSSQGTTTWTARGTGGGSQAWDPAGSGDHVPTNITGLDAQCVGTVTGTLKWVPTTGQDSTTDPPPSQVIVTESGFASFTGGGTAGPGVLSDGWSADTPPASPNDIYGPHYYYNAQGTHYEVKDGTSGTVTLGPFSLNASTPTVTDSNAGNDTILAYVNINFLAASVEITPDGAKQDTSGKYNILVGQGCTATLLGTPSVGTTYSWNVSGTTFQDWQHTTPADPKANPPRLANTEASYYVPGSGPLTNPTAHWFWNDPGPASTPETITCTANVTPNDGKSAPYTVNATRTVNVLVPSWRANGIGGYVQINIDCPDEGGKGVMAFWAGPYPPVGQNDAHNGGMDWLATCTTPQLPVAFGTGTLELVQLATPNRSYTTNANPPVLHPSKETTKGLDSYYPYHSSSPTAYVEGGPAYAAFDDPRIPLDNINAGSVSMAESFDDYLLYLPPGTDVRWVPLANFTWTTNGSATIPKPSNDWSNYNVSGPLRDKAGTVSPSTAPPKNPTAAPFTPWNTHPKWTLINLFHAF